jgi:thiol-disulfide isomerase/thioredoxin
MASMSRLQLSRSRVWVAVAAALLAVAPTGGQVAAVPLTPSKGDVVPAFQTLGVNGTPWKLDFPRGSTTVLLFFMSSCPHCHKMIPEWNRAYERRSKGVKVVGILLDQEPPGFWSTIAIAFPVLRAPSREFLRSLNVNHVPLTLRVGEGGRVEDFAVGVADPIRVGELFAPPN